jgi:hypothetical protein
MFRFIAKIFKTLAVVVVGGIVILVIFYLSYIMIFLLLLAILFGIGWICANWQDINAWADKD